MIFGGFWVPFLEVVHKCYLQKNPKGGYFRGFRTPPTTDRNSESKTGSKNKAQVKLKTPNTLEFRRTLRV